MYVEQVEEFVPTLRWRFMVEWWRRLYTMWRRLYNSFELKGGGGGGYTPCGGGYTTAKILLSSPVPIGHGD